MKKITKRTVLLLFLSMTCMFSFAQSHSVSGVVKDNAGEAMIGVSVAEKGTGNGTITDFDGKYTLTAGRNAVLVFSYVGYIPQEIAVAGKTVINVTLEEDNSQLEELVVVGYGTIKRRDLTGSVSSVKSADIERVSSSNAMQALQAQVPGLDIRQSDGQAGGGLSITMRGTRSIVANNNPLILVDGVQYGSTIDINPSDIESIEVLKDASSTAIYGTKGANGVIIITTKRGSPGKTQVNFNSFVSVNTPTHVPQVMYGDKQVQMYIDADNYAKDLASGNWGSANAAPADVLTYQVAGVTELDIYNDGSYTNWLDVILQNGLTQNYVASVSGGNQKTSFNASLGAMYEEGLLKNDYLDRYNGKLTLDHRISKILKIGTSLQYAYRNLRSRNSSVFGTSLKMTSITHPYQDDVMVMAPNPRYPSHVNPLADEVENASVRNNESTRLFGNAYLEIAPIQGMLFKSTFALSRRNGMTGRYDDYNSVARYQSSPRESEMSSRYDASTAVTWNNILSYNTNFGGSKHDVTIMAGHEMRQSVDTYNQISGLMGAEHYYKNLYYDVSKITTSTRAVAGGYTKDAMLSYFGRLNYKFNERYLLTASIRTDGFSALATGHKWGVFPSLAAAWRISEESFMEDTKSWLSNLKLRASWGVSGNAAIDPYQTLTLLSADVIYYYLNGNSIPGKIPSQMGNKESKWETTNAWDFGLDFGFLNGRIAGSIDYYMSHTDGLLYRRSLPPTSAFTTVLSNIGETKGNGLEVAVNFVPVKTKDFQWDSNLSYTTNRDEIVALSDGNKRNLSGREGHIVGQPVNIYYDYQANGTWNVGEFDNYKAAWESSHEGQTFTSPLAAYGQPGTIKIVDRNDDGKIDEDDKMVYSRAPKHILGWSNTFTYKNLSLSVLLYARFGGYISYDFNNLLVYDSANWGELDYWTPSNPNAKFPSPGLSGTGVTTYTTYSTSLLYEKADYLKIKDITLNYRLPKKAINSIGLGGISVYASLKNYLTFAKIPNYDPERNGSISFPLAKQAVFGININF
ncbi:MAG: TonB-dependent receptor [Paludibacter sp.]|nr:TonB-dependent receptor [Paludibacter sp.]